MYGQIEAAAPVGAGLITNKQSLEHELTKQWVEYNKNHYVFLPGGCPPNGDLDLSDRELSIKKVMRGRITLLVSHRYVDRNMTLEALVKLETEDEPEFLNVPKTAYDQAKELFDTYGAKGTSPRGLVILSSLTGKQPDFVQRVEEVLLPKIPDTLMDLAIYLRDVSAKNIAEVKDPVLAAVAKACHKEMLAACSDTYIIIDDHLQTMEGEQVDRSKPNGFGKAKIDRFDKYYYGQLKRDPKYPGGQVISPINSNVPINQTQSSQQVQVAPTPQAELKECPECAEFIMLKAKKCRFCDYKYPAQEVVAETTQETSSGKKKDK